MNNNNDILYKEKYLKYKQKYLELKTQEGGLLYLNYGEYLFFYRSQDVDTDTNKTPLLKSLEEHNGQIVNAKPDLTKIGNEITNNGTGYYFKKGAKDAILFKSATSKIIKNVKQVYKKARGQDITTPPILGLLPKIPLDSSSGPNKKNLTLLMNKMLDELNEKVQSNDVTFDRVILGTIGLSGHVVKLLYPSKV